MIKNFDTVITDLERNEIKEENVNITMKKLCANALGGVFQDENNLSGEEKFKRYELALKIMRGGEVDILPEEITLLKKLTGKMYSTFVVGRIYEFLNS